MHDYDIHDYNVMDDKMKTAPVEVQVNVEDLY